jgi:acyl-homoserine-lactone acylase
MGQLSPARAEATRWRWLGTALAVVVASLSAGAPAGAAEEGNDAGGAVAPTVQSLEPGRHLAAEIRRTEYGIPHIKADDWAGLGYGYGYAFAEDNACLLAEMVVTATARRSLVFGADEDNLSSDVFHQQLIDLRIIEDTLARPADHPAPPPSDRVRDLVAGTAAGYNRYLSDVGGAAGIEDPACSGADWVREIDEIDLWRTYLDSALRAGRGALDDEVVAAQPPTAGATEAAGSLAPAPATELGSNAYGLGREATVSGGGMLLANPHFPWQGRDRFYEMHLTIPGEYDMIGVALAGQPVVEIGHNATMGWSHTVSTARRFTLYELQLVPGNPTQYVVDGQVRDMTSQVVEVEARQPDGTVSTTSRTLWSTEYGPIVTVDPLTWSDTTAYALRDVNEDAGRTLDGFIEMGRSSSVRALKDTLDRWQHLPWINTIAADSTGEAFYGDHSVVPNLDDEKLEACITDLGRIALDQLGVFILDGADGGCRWGTDPDARVPGIIGPSQLPTLFRDDYVTNSNDSYWLANPEQPLEGFDRIIGEERTERSLRTRLGLRQVQQRLDGTDGLEGTGFTLDRLQQVMFSNRVYGAELALADLVGLCQATPTVDVEGTTVDLTEACAVLADWDGRVDLDSRGAHVFREFVEADGLVWAVPFDEADPVDTPNTLAVDDPAVLTALGTAVLTLQEAGVPLGARLGDVQGEPRGARVIPIHGGTGGMGAFNVISAPLDETDAYRDVQSGASFILAAEFTPDGPRSRALLSYSNATDPTSPHYADQTELYSRKQWVDLDYLEADILADPELMVTVIEEDVPVPPSPGRAVWREGVGRDARGLPATAQAPVGPGALDRIVGTLGSPNDDDMYRLCVDGDEPFVARLLGGTPAGGQLFLFDAEGRPLAAAPATGALRVAAPAAGVHHLAVSRVANDPLGRAGALFPSPLTGPGGPAAGRAGAAVVDWSDGDRSTATTPEAYRIDLRGASAC